MSRIVVGVDGSSGARAALRFAVEEARLRGATLRLVTAWHVPPMAYSGGWVAPFDARRVRATARRPRATKALAAVREEIAGLEVQRVAGEGQAARVLLEEATGRRSPRRRHAWTRRVCRSPARVCEQQCAHHAPCPVIIVNEAEATR